MLLVMMNFISDRYFTKREPNIIKSRNLVLLSVNTMPYYQIYILKYKQIRYLFGDYESEKKYDVLLDVLLKPHGITAFFLFFISYQAVKVTKPFGVCFVDMSDDLLLNCLCMHTGRGSKTYNFNTFCYIHKVAVLQKTQNITKSFCLVCSKYLITLEMREN